MYVYMVRHGQTEWNVQRKMQGRGDSPLTELGIEQAQKTATLLESVNFDAAFCSPAGRAVSTANIILQGHGVKAEVFDSFAEIDLGEWEGSVYDQASGKCAQERELFWYKPDQFTAKTSKGETFDDVRLRVMGGLERLAAGMDQDCTILVVSHTVAIRSVLNHFSGRPLAKFWDDPIMDPGSASLLEYYSPTDGAVLSYAGTPPITAGLLE